MGCCPDYDAEGRQMNMVCVCGARIPITSRFSICEGCMNAEEVGPGEYRHRTPEDAYEDGEPWVGGYGADGNWETEYWKKRALAAEARAKGDHAKGQDPCPGCYGRGVDPFEGFTCDECDGEGVILD